MALLHYDQKFLKLRVMIKPNETFIPNEDLDVFQKEADQIFNDYQELIGRLKVFLKKCEDWNKEHEKNLEEK